jgi:hypothetical protein
VSQVVGLAIEMGQGLPMCLSYKVALRLSEWKWTWLQEYLDFEEH